MPPEPPPKATSTTGPPSWMAPVMPVVPDHELLRRIGGGSYGDVWLARTAVGTWRAVKVVFRDRFTDGRPYEREFNGIQKFEPLSRGNEAFIDILQIGRNDAEGYFYYVMELADDAGAAGKSDQCAVASGQDSVSGDQSSVISNQAGVTEARHLLNTGFNSETYVPKTLSKVLLQRGRLPLGECLELGLTLNLGLAHLHKAGLIHRDIKPSNLIFVGGVPKLADIGLVIEVAEARSYVGTEGFIPPEGPNSPQADLYSLGKMLYEAGMGKDRKDFPEPFTQIIDAPDSAQLLEFNAILLKACAANVKERYQSAEEMNADLALLQSGGSVRRQRKLAGQLRFVQRAGAIATVLAAVIALGWWWQVRQTAKVRELAAENLNLAQQADASATAARENLYAADINLAQQALQSDNLRLARSLLQNHVPKPGQPDLRGFEWRYLWHQCRSEELFSFPARTNGSRVLAISPEGRHLAVGGYEGGNIRLLDLRLHREVAMLEDTNAILSLSFSSGSELLASGSANDIRLWDTRSFQEVRRLTNAAAPALFSPDGRFLLTGRGPWRRSTGWWNQPEELLVWDTQTWTVINRATFPGSGPPSGARDLYLQVTFGTDASRAAVLSGGTVRLVSCPELKELLVLPEHLPESTTFRPFVALSPDNRTLGIPSPKGFGVRLWDTVENRELRILAGHLDHVYSARFSSDGTLLATASPDQTTKLWQVATGELLHTFRGQADEVVDVVFSPDGATLASLGITESVVMLWDIRSRPRGDVLPRWLVPQGFDPGGNLAGFSRVRQAVMLDPADLKLTPFPVPRLRAGAGFASKLNSLSSDGRYQGLLVVPEDRLEVWDRRLRKRLCSVPARDGRFSFDTRRNLVSTGIMDEAGQDMLAAWQLPTGKLKWQVAGFMGPVITGTAQGDYVTTERGTEAQVSRIEGEQLSPVLKVPLGDIAISPNGRLLASATGDITLRNLPSGQVVGVLKGHTRKGIRLAFSPDSRTLASIADDHTARLWDLTTQRELLRFLGGSEDNDIYRLEFSPDGRALACYRRDDKDPVTSLYFAPSFAEIAVAEGGDYRAAAGQDAPTWLAVSQELLRRGHLEEAWEACSRAVAMAKDREEMAWWLIPRLERHQIELLRRLGRMDEAGVENIRLLKLPARDPATPDGAIDLSARYTTSLAWDEAPETSPTDLRELPSGSQAFAGTVFDARGIIEVAESRPDWPSAGEPARVEGIRLQRRLARLHFLQAADGRDEGVKTSDRIGHYRVHYADGRSVELPIRFNVDISDWWAHSNLPKELPEATVAWQGFTLRGRPQGDQPIRVFKRSWENPFPDVEVTALDFVAEHPRVHPVLIALTAE